MTKAYMVATVGYEYNDEGYSPVGNYGTMYERINDVYSDRDVAESMQLEYTKDKVREVAGDHYGFGQYAAWGNVIGGVYNESLEEIFGEGYADNNEYRLFIPEDATPEQITAVAKLLRDEFYEVVQIEIQ